MNKLLSQTKRGLLSLSLSVAAMSFLASCEKNADTEVQPAPTAAIAAQDFISVDQMVGINVNQEYYYNRNIFKDIKNTGFNTVRIVIRPDDADTKERTAWVNNGQITGIKTMMRDAKAQGLNVMLAYYVRKDMDIFNPNATASAAQWWVDNLSTLMAEGDFALNLLNEPKGKGASTNTSDGQKWRNDHTNAIGRIRGKGFSGNIIIDAPGYAHEVKVITDFGAQVAPGTSKVYYSLHVYPDSFYNGALPGTTSPGSGGGDVTFMNNLRDAAQHPIIIGEFGDTGGNFHDYRGRVQEFVNNAQSSKANCGAIGWTWVGDGTKIGNVSYPMNANVDSNYAAWLKNTAVN